MDGSETVSDVVDGKETGPLWSYAQSKAEECDGLDIYIQYASVIQLNCSGGHVFR